MFQQYGLVLVVVTIQLSFIQSAIPSEHGDPKFIGPIVNVTAAIGREAILTCTVHNLGSYKVAWLRVDTQTILTIQNHVITKNHRVGVTYTEKKTWQLRLKDIRESDRGWYMCQINTDPMKSQTGYLDVVVPPDILDYPTSTDMVVREGANVTLRCAATGSPPPQIVWRRENGLPITLPNGVEVASVEGSTFTLPKVDRKHMGPYLCIASNGVPPTVSKRIKITVEFPPQISVPNQLVGAVEGQWITLECLSEAYPKSINYWTRDKGEFVPVSSTGGKYEPIFQDNAYKVSMKLNINAVSSSDFGTYKCVAKNALGDTDGTIKLYKIPKGTLDGNNALLESVRRGKSRKGSGYYDPNDIADDDTEGLSKRKDLVYLGQDAGEYGSSSNYCSKLSLAMLVISFAGLRIC